MTNSSKILLWIFIITAIVAGGLWIMGGKRTECTTALLINADPETVFSYLVEPDKLKDWVEGLSTVEKIEPNPITNGVLMVTTTSRTVVVNGKATLFQDEVLRFGQDTNLTIKSTNSKVSLTSIFGLEPRDDGTFLTYRVKTLNRGLGRLMAPLKKDTTQARIDEEIRRLKDLVESNTAWASSPYQPDQENQ